MKEKVYFEYEKDWHGLNPQEESALLNVEKAFWGLPFEGIKRVLAEFIARTDKAGYYPHWLEQPEPEFPKQGE